MKTFISAVAAVFSILSVAAQNKPGYWQQEVDYKMEIDMDVSTFQYTGKQELTYTNNSPDRTFSGKNGFIQSYFKNSSGILIRNRYTILSECFHPNVSYFRRR